MNCWVCWCPKGVASIMPKAFKDCKDLKAVIIPDGVTAIGSGAFTMICLLFWPAVGWIVVHTRSFTSTLSKRVNIRLILMSGIVRALSALTRISVFLAKIPVYLRYISSCFSKSGYYSLQYAISLPKILFVCRWFFCRPNDECPSWREEGSS